MKIESVISAKQSAKLEIEKPKPVIQNTEINSADNRNSLIGERRTSENFTRFRLNNVLDANFRPLSADRAEAAAEKVNHTSSQPKTFTTPEGIPAADAYFTTPGTEVAELTAEQIKETEGPMAQAMFYRALDRHKDDAEWLHRFYQTLGTDKTAELIQDTVSSLPPAGERERDLLGSSLQMLNRAGYLTEGDTDALLGKVAVTEDGSIHKGASLFLTEAVSGVSNDSAGLSLKNMFAESAANLATGNLPLNVDGDNLNEAKDFLAAMATHTIASTPEYNQAAKLNGLRYSLGENGLQELFSRAMKLDQWLFPPDGQERENFDNVGTLLKTLSTHPFALQNTRVAVFNAVTQNLTGDAAEKYNQDANFKDGLANIFMKDFNEILKSSYGDGKYTNGIDFIKGQGLENFFRSVVFSSEPSSNANEVVQFLGSKMREISSAIESNDQSYLRLLSKDGNTPLSRNEAANVMGHLFGLAGAAFKDYADSLPDEAAKRTAWFGFVVNVVSGTAGNAPANPAVGGLLGAITDEIGGRIHDNMTQQELENLSEEFAQKLGIENPEEFLKRLVSEIRDSFAEGNEFAQTFGTVSGIPLN